jgi:hypothetical protein
LRKAQLFRPASYTLSCGYAVVRSAKGRRSREAISTHTGKRSLSANRAAKPRVYEKYLENAQSSVTTTAVVAITAI